ncbi:MAG: RluA family pseudouridine synthase [Blautia sp.]|nr:RluA family pseudouridine synthase [Blautia sp.]
MEEELIFLAEQESDGSRIDRFLALSEPEHSRSFYQKLIEDGMVCVDDKPVRANYRVKPGDRIRVLCPEPEPLNVEPEDIPLDILYEDEDLMVVNKPRGMVVHPAAGHYSGTLVNAVLFHCRGSLSGINGILRPGIVHRIDKDTSGALLICKTDAAHRALADQLKVHSITRRYRAVAAGRFPQMEGTVDAPIGRHPTDRKKMAINPRTGKNAVTHYRVLSQFEKAAYLECTLETGRTHQIRVHMASIGHPLLGDPVYGSGKDPYHLNGQALHAMVLGFIHPTSGEYMEFTAPLPEYFTGLLDRLL